MVKLRSLGRNVLKRAAAKALSAAGRIEERGGELKNQLEERVRKSEYLANLKEGFQAPSDSAPSEPEKMPASAAPRSTGSGETFSFGDKRKAVQVFGGRSCPWSGRAVRLLESQRVKVSYMDLDLEGSSAIVSELQAETGQFTVPYIYVRGHFIGGFNALDEIHRLGQLEYLLLSDEEKPSHANHGKIEVLARHSARDALDRPPGS